MVGIIKKLGFSVSLALLAVNFSHATERNISAQVSDVNLQLVLSTLNPLDLINWKVGDSSDYNVLAGSFGNLGKMKKFVSKDEGAALWVVQDLDLAIQKQKIEILINKADGKILKMLVNGQEQSVPDDQIEIISQDYVDVTVPAGTFKAIHILAKSKQAPKIEFWANPKDVPMEGMIKTIQATQMGFDLTLELTSFKRAN